MTRGVINKAYDRYPPYVDIKKVNSAATLDETLFLNLQVQSQDRPVSRTVVLKVPFEDIDTYRHGPPAVPLDLDGLSLQRPSLGYFEPTTTFPRGVKPLNVEYVDPGGRQALDDHIYNLPIGIHVLIVLDLYTKADRKDKPEPEPDGTIPSKARLTLVWRIPDGAPRVNPLWPYSESPQKNRAWLFMTPLAVVGDIVTFPVQLLIVFGD
jgi:hypothetical protein